MPKEFLNCYKNKKVGFIGLGISNLPVARLLRDNGTEVILRDKNEPDTYEPGFEYITGANYLDNINEDILFLAPAVRSDLPRLAEAEKNGVVLTTEMQEFFKHCRGTIIAVTGSDGKSTTTTIISKILEAGGRKAFLGGNIGRNLFCQLDEITEEDFAVCELSSFQLMKMSKSPHIAVITNLSPNHLDWHTDFDEYKNAKKNILKYQNKNDICILNIDDDYFAEYSACANGKIIYVSGRKRLENGVWFDDDGLYYNSEKIIDDSDILLVGRHNRYNYSQAIAATLQYADKTAVSGVASSFGGVEHRCQFIRETGGIKYYNSSIDSSPTRTSAALSSFKNKVIIIAGGYDKKIPLEPLGRVFDKKTKAAVLIGDTADKIEKILKEANYSGKIKRAGSMEEAVDAARSLAVPGDTILLSPAAASFGMFKNFEERGKKFIDKVNSLE